MQTNILIAQGGGPTAVINQSLAGVVTEARKFRQVGQIYGALHGVRGIVDESTPHKTNSQIEQDYRQHAGPECALETLGQFPPVLEAEYEQDPDQSKQSARCAR